MASAVSAMQKLVVGNYVMREPSSRISLRRLNFRLELLKARSSHELRQSFISLFGPRLHQLPDLHWAPMILLRHLTLRPSLGQSKSCPPGLDYRPIRGSWSSRWSCWFSPETSRRAVYAVSYRADLIPPCTSSPVDLSHESSASV